MQGATAALLRGDVGVGRRMGFLSLGDGICPPFSPRLVPLRLPGMVPLLISKGVARGPVVLIISTDARINHRTVIIAIS